MKKVYSPLPIWPPALAAAILLAGYVVGPILGRVLTVRTLNHCARIFDDNLADIPD